jgi:hypothetical protein
MKTPENTWNSAKLAPNGFSQAQEDQRIQRMGGLIRGGQAWPSQVTVTLAVSVCAVLTGMRSAVSGRSALRWQTAQAMQPGPSWQLSAAVSCAEFDDDEASRPMWMGAEDCACTECKAWASPVPVSCMSGWGPSDKAKGVAALVWWLCARCVALAADACTVSAEVMGMSAPAHNRRGKSTNIHQIQDLRIHT